MLMTANHPAPYSLSPPDSWLRDQSVLVLGLGDTGLSCVHWLLAQGARVSVADTRANPPHAATLGREYPQVALHCGALTDVLLQSASLIVASPGVPLSTPALQAALARGQEVLGDVELFARTVQSWSTPPRVVAITGSNGKTTVTTLVGEIARAAGLSCQVLGNIGTPVLEGLHTLGPAEVYVLELSSFQLETTHTLQLLAGTVLNVTEDHLDRYAHMAAYAGAKARIFRHCALQVVNRQDPWSRSMADAQAQHEGALHTARKCLGFGLDAPDAPGNWGLQPIVQTQQTAPAPAWICCGQEQVLRTDRLALQGLHNVANVMAALALADALGIARRISVPVVQGFKGLPHRVEWVARINGVTYLDDSKGTNVGATVAALTGLAGPVVLIAGGDGKGQDFAPLKPALARNGRAVILIGRDAGRIRRALEGCPVPQHLAGSLEQAVQWAAQCAQAGDQVLLSPACASFDMFRDYQHRAQVFIQAVQALAPDGDSQAATDHSGSQP